MNTARPGHPSQRSPISLLPFALHFHHSQLNSALVHLSSMNINETYYTIQPTPNGMPRSVQELRDELKRLGEHDGRDFGVAELIELLTSQVDDSSGTDDDAGEDSEEMGEATPTTPLPGSAVSVLFIDD